MFCIESPFQGPVALLKLLIHEAVKYMPMQGSAVQSIDLFSITDMPALHVFTWTKSLHLNRSRDKLKAAADGLTV